MTNRRRSERFEVALPIWLKDGRGGEYTTTADVSSHGIAVFSPTARPLRQYIELEIALPAPRANINVTAVVARHADLMNRETRAQTAGLGLDFFLFDASAKARWKAFLEKLRTDGPGFLKTPEPGAPEVEAGARPLPERAKAPVELELPSDLPEDDETPTFIIKPRDLGRLWAFYRGELAKGRVRIETPVAQEDGTEVELLVVHPTSQAEWILEGYVAETKSKAERGKRPIIEINLVAVTSELKTIFRNFVATGRGMIEEDVEIGDEPSRAGEPPRLESVVIDLDALDDSSVDLPSGLQDPPPPLPESTTDDLEAEADSGLLDAPPVFATPAPLTPSGLMAAGTPEPEILDEEDVDALPEIIASEPIPLRPPAPAITSQERPSRVLDGPTEEELDAEPIETGRPRTDDLVVPEIETAPPTVEADGGNDITADDGQSGRVSAVAIDDASERPTHERGAASYEEPVTPSYDEPRMPSAIRGGASKGSRHSEPRMPIALRPVEASRDDDTDTSPKAPSEILAAASVMDATEVAPKAPAERATETAARAVASEDPAASSSSARSTRTVPSTDTGRATETAAQRDASPERATEAAVRVAEGRARSVDATDVGAEASRASADATDVAPKSPRANADATEVAPKSARAKVAAAKTPHDDDTKSSDALEGPLGDDATDIGPKAPPELYAVERDQGTVRGESLRDADDAGIVARATSSAPHAPTTRMSSAHPGLPEASPPDIPDLPTLDERQTNAPSSEEVWRRIRSNEGWRAAFEDDEDETPHEDEAEASFHEDEDPTFTHDPPVPEPEPTPAASPATRSVFASFFEEAAASQRPEPAPVDEGPRAVPDASQDLPPEQNPPILEIGSNELRALRDEVDEVFRDEHTAREGEAPARDQRRRLDAVPSIAEHRAASNARRASSKGPPPPPRPEPNRAPSVASLRRDAARVMRAADAPDANTEDRDEGAILRLPTSAIVTDGLPRAPSRATVEGSQRFFTTGTSSDIIAARSVHPEPPKVVTGRGIEEPRRAPPPPPEPTNQQPAAEAKRDTPELPDWVVPRSEALANPPRPPSDMFEPKRAEAKRAGPKSAPAANTPVPPGSMYDFEEEEAEDHELPVKLAPHGGAANRPIRQNRPARSPPPPPMPPSSRRAALPPEDREHAGHKNLSTESRDPELDRDIGLARARVVRSPHSVTACYRLSMLLMQRTEENHVSEALDSLKRVMTLEPNHPGAHHKLAELLARKGDYALAAEHLSRARRLGYRIDPDLERIVTSGAKSS